MSQSVPPELITQTWQEIDNLPEDGISQLVEQMASGQSDLFAYLLAADESLSEHTGFDFVVYLGLAMWQMMKHWYRKIAPISQDDLLQAESKNRARINKIAASPDFDLWAATEHILDHYPEPDMLGSVIALLLDTGREDLNMPPDALKTAYIYVKSVLDALIKAC